jgi:hypothetical protein
VELETKGCDHPSFSFDGSAIALVAASPQGAKRFSFLRLVSWGASGWEKKPLTQKIQNFTFGIVLKV